MDKVEVYRKHIQNLLGEHASHGTPYGEETEIQTIFDTVNDHYQLVQTGWRDMHRLYGCILHVDIKDGKIWIQQDGTEVGLANELVELGVPKEDIVLAFHSPFKRQFTSFAVN